MPLYISAVESLPGVEYVGSLSQPQLAEALAGASILAYPNTYAETSCIAVMEAALGGRGLFVVTSDLGALAGDHARLGFARLVPPAQRKADVDWQRISADYEAALRQVLAVQARDPRLLRRGML